MTMLNLFGKKKQRRKPAASGGGLFHAIRAHFAAAESAAKDADWWKADYLSADADASPAIRADVKLDLSLIDADRVAGDCCTESGGRLSPAAETGGSRSVATAEGCGKPFAIDGITYDQYGNPVSYRVLVSHPCDGNLAEERAMLIPAANMIHVFRADRAEQHRGVPELAAALPLFAKLRRYTNAVVASAEKAAEYGGILYTEHPTDGTCAQIEPMDAVTLDVNQLTTMPEGWKMDELYVKAPIATYADFKKEMLSEIGAAMGIPYAIVAGTSAGYTYASAKLDHQTYFRVLRNERGFVEDSVLNRLFALWLREWSLAHPDVKVSGGPQSSAAESSHPCSPNASPSVDGRSAIDHSPAIPLISTWNASWLWPMFDNIDMLTAARVQSIALKNRTTTLATEYARQGKNWRTELAQFEKEQRFLSKLRIDK